MSSLAEPGYFRRKSAGARPAGGVLRLGDRIESALTAVGVTKERVAAWLGAECGCRERRDKLNQLSAWAENATLAALDNLLGNRNASP